MKKIIPLLILFVFSARGFLHAQDWPIYKGNIYFTGNNDEIVIKNANLKWLFQANERTFNPIASDGKVYFLDQNADLYALDEEYGRLQWKVDFQKIAVQFKAFSKSAGKVKYPLIKDNTIFLSDPIAIYALDKRNGAVLWARTGMRQEELPKAAGGLMGRAPLPQVDGIYADPVIQENNIYYGTRNMFLSREIRNGHEGWENRDIKTYSAYPTFYDDKIITQSMNYKTNIYSVYCLDAATGKQIWIQNIEKPQRIFPPVVYSQKVYVPVNKSIYCLDYKTGDKIWSKDYDRFITSNPSFTDHAILFTLDNSDMAVVSPSDGNILSSVALGQGSSPYFITVRDNLYLAYNEKKTVNGKDLSYGTVRAINFNDNSNLWTFTAPFPGPVSQPVASKGILFLPAGNYIYAIGTEYYAKVVQGGEGYAVVDKKPVTEDDAKKKKLVDMLAELDPQKTPEKAPDKIPATNPQAQEKKPIEDQNKPVEEKKLVMKPLTVTVGDDGGKPITAQVEVRKWDKDRLVYSDTQIINSKADIQVPAGDGVEITGSANGYIPKKEILDGNEKDKEIRLEKIEKGKTFVVDNINFEFGKAYLKKESINILDRVVRIMKENAKLKIEVRGHTDNVGEASYNQKLSEKRADAVAEFMIKQGISPERIKSKGFGMTKPLLPNSSEANRAKNRRTEFTFE